MKRKVCVLCTVHKYNDNRVYYKQVLSLAEFGYDVTYIAPNITEKLSDLVKTVSITPSKNYLKGILRCFKIFNLVKKQHCEVVHFHDPELIFVGFLLKMFTKIKVVYDVHEDYPADMLTKSYLKNYIRKPLCKIIQILEKICGKYFDAIVVADNSVYTHFPPNKTTILFNYPSLKLLEESEKQTNNVEKMYDIIFPGTTERFIVDMFLDIMRIAKGKGRQLKGIIISPFNFIGGKDYVANKAKDYGIEKELQLMNRIPPYEVTLYLKSAKIGLIPLPDTLKLRANIPTKMFEYMYFRLPVITGNLPPSAYYMNKHSYGFMVNPNSAEEYVEKIFYLLDNPKIIQEFGDTAYNLIVQQYNWEAEAIKFKEMYVNLLQ